MACIVRGKETTGFSLDVVAGAIIDGTINWVINDDTTTSNFVGKTLAEQILYQFQTPGTKSITATVDFDDGWGNVYQHTTALTITVSTYDTPVIDFSWNPQNPVINEQVAFQPSITDTRDDALGLYYGKVSAVQIDVFDDGVIDSESVNKNDPHYYTFSQKQKGIPVRMIVWYDDGFNLQKVDLIKTLDMGNIPPVASFTTNDEGKCVPSYTWNATSTDADDSTLEHYWTLELFDGANWNIISTATNQTFNWVFQQEGQYRITLISTDADGASSTSQQEFTVKTGTCSTDGPSTFFIEWE